MCLGPREIADGTAENGAIREGEEVARLEEVRKEGKCRVVRMYFRLLH